MASDPFILVAGETGTQGSELRLYPDGAIVVTAPEWGPDREDGIEFKPDHDKLRALLSMIVPPPPAPLSEKDRERITEMFSGAIGPDAAAKKIRGMDQDAQAQIRAAQKSLSQALQTPGHMSGADLRAFLDMSDLERTFPATFEQLDSRPGSLLDNLTPKDTP